MTSPAETAFNEHAAALRRLGASLGTASSIRYEASPGMARTSSADGIPNPTLDIVLDQRRSAVSDEVTRAAFDLWRATEIVNALTERLDTAIERWQGDRH